jgi:hypothetical protein
VLSEVVNLAQHHPRDVQPSGSRSRPCRHNWPAGPYLGAGVLDVLITLFLIHGFLSDMPGAKSAEPADIEKQPGRSPTA